jgi:hypothetical protein
MLLCVVRSVVPNVAKVRDAFIVEGNQSMRNDSSRTYYPWRRTAFRNAWNLSTNEKPSILHGLTTFKNEDSKIFRKIGNRSHNDKASHIREPQQHRCEKLKPLNVRFNLGNICYHLVQNILCSGLRFKTTQTEIQIYKLNIIHSVQFTFYVYCPTNVHVYLLLICETQCYMFRNLILVP